MNIYVGNISWNLNDQDLANLFAPYGEVASAKIVRDKFSQRSKGFGFVEMQNDTEAQNAIQALNGSEVDGRPLVVNESRPRPESSNNGYRKKNFGGGYKKNYGNYNRNY
ncbi:MAG: RNA-binding protein [Chitinophagaceae bacterium]|nr:RNA-binding protein [Chitinophagaceae bacterium]